jgi:hypothetical protein
MTVASATNRVSYSGNGSSTVFAVPFYFLADSHLLVVLKSAAGVDTTQVLGTNYSVSGAGVESGGTVTMNVAPPIGTTLTISRNVPITQETDLQPNDRLPAESLEDALDKLTMIDQQINENAIRAIKVPVSDSTTLNTTLDTASVRANKYLAFNNIGEPIATNAPTGLATVNETQIATAGQTVFSLANSYVPGISNLDVFVDGVNQYPGSAYTETNSNTVTFASGLHAGAEVRFTTARTLSTGESVAATTTYVPAGAGAVQTNVQAKLRESVSVKDFGAVGDGVTDDAAAIQAAISASNNVFFPAGTYKISTSINLKSDLILAGEGDATVIEYTGTGYAIHYPNKTTSSVNNVCIRDLTVSTSTGSGVDFEAVYESEISGNTSIIGHPTTPVAGKYGLHTGHADVLVSLQPSYWNKFDLNKMQGFTHCWYADPNSNSIWFSVRRFKAPITQYCVYVAPPSGVYVSSGIDITILDVGNIDAPDTVFFDGRNLRMWMRHEDGSSNAIHLGENHRAVDVFFHTMEANVQVKLDNLYVDGIIRAGLPGSKTQNVYQGYSVNKFSKESQNAKIEDQFVGTSLSNLWTTSGTGSATLVDSTSGAGTVKVSSGATSGDAQTLTFGVPPIRSAARNPARFFGRIRLNTITNCLVQFGLKKDTDAAPLSGSKRGVWFEVDPPTTTTWRGKQAGGGGNDTADTLVTASAVTLNFIIDFAEDGSGKFYIDGELKGDLSAGTNKDSVSKMAPFVYIETKENVDKNIEVELFRLDIDCFNFV